MFFTPPLNMKIQNLIYVSDENCDHDFSEEKATESLEIILKNFATWFECKVWFETMEIEYMKEEGKVIQNGYFSRVEIIPKRALVLPRNGEWGGVAKALILLAKLQNQTARDEGKNMEKTIIL